MSSRYNTGVPININELSIEERRIAFHEWAEGSEALEKLLNVGYDRGFTSYACCAGDTGKPYVEYRLNDEMSRKMAMSIAKQLIDSGLDCQISFDDDFVYTEEEYKEMRDHLLENFPEDFSEKNYSPTRTITGLCVCAKIENIEEVFESMANCIRNAELDNIKLPENKSEIPIRNFNENTKGSCGTQMINSVVAKSADMGLGEIANAMREVIEAEQELNKLNKSSRGE